MRAVQRLFVAAAIVAILAVPATAQAMTYTQARRLSTSKVKSLVVAEAKREHLSSANLSALLSIGKRESNFHATSSNHGRCLGVFQLSKSMCSGHPWSDPTWNTRRAIKYMNGRYSSPARAWSFWCRHGWY